MYLSHNTELIVMVHLIKTTPSFKIYYIEKMKYVRQEKQGNLTTV